VTEIQTATASAPEPSLPSRLAGVFFSPRATYAAVAARPKVFGALACVLVVCSVSLFAFLSTEVGRQAMIDQQVRQLEAFGRTVSDAQYARMEQVAPYGRYFGAAGQLVSLPLAALVVAGLAFACFNAILGGDAGFKQVYAIVAHSGVIIAAQQLFSLPLAYARESLSGATNVAVFFPFLDENTFASRLLGAVDLFLVWWLVSLAIGFGVLYRRRTAPIATTMLLVYASIGLIIAAVKTAVSGV
jgi:Yip1 domain